MNGTQRERAAYEGELRELLREYRRICGELPAARRNTRWLGISILAACLIALGIVLFPFFSDRSGWTAADWTLNLFLAGTALLSTALQVRNLGRASSGSQSLRELSALFDSLRDDQTRAAEEDAVLADAVTEDIFDCVIRLEMLDRAWEDLPGIGFLGGTLGGVALLTVLAPCLLAGCRWGFADWLLNLVLLAACVSLLVFELALTGLTIRGRQRETALHNCFRSVREDLRDLSGTEEAQAAEK